MHTTLRHSALIALGLWLAASAATAQSLSGVVREDASGNALEGVHVVLVDAEGQRVAETFTNVSGTFRIVAPEAGSWVVMADLIGYASIESEPLEMGLEERLTVEIRMAVEAVPVDPVVVTSRFSHMSAQIEAFYNRVERGRLSGFGHFVTREDVDRATPTEPTDLLRTMPGVRVAHGRTVYGGSTTAIQMAGGCIPAIYVDGTQINRFRATDSLDDFVAATSIEGIEVYRGAGTQVGRYHDDRGCGLVLVWTRRGAPDGSPFTWTRFIIGASLLLGIVLIN